MADDASLSAARPSLRHANSGNGKIATPDSGSAPASAISSGISAPPGHAFRRAKTVADTIGIGARQSGSRRFSSDSNFESPPPGPRRSSNFSEYSINEARSILNPHREAAAAASQGSAGHAPESSSLAGLSLAFALLPPVAGALFTNGGAVVTDIMLLGLAGVFLHWSVTQPWLWYHSAQQVRIEQEENSEDVVIEEESDDEPYHDGQSNLDNVPEEETPRSKIDEIAPGKQSPSVRQQTALSELYVHEVMALLSCFSLPLISAYILHMIRSQLSRPSEGLVSNFNLTVFILVSELRVLSHIIKLVQARTLYLQRVVHSNPYGALPTTNSLRINAILERLEVLESDAGSRNVLQEEDDETESTKTAAQEAALTKDVRNAIQPELDALNRAVRRYEKKSTLLQSHVDAHFVAMDARVEDAIALAAVAAKNSSQSSVLVRGLDAVVSILLFPFNAVLQLLLFPVTWLLSPTQNGGNRKKHAVGATSGNTARGAGGSKASSRSSHGSKSLPSQQRFAGDKMPSRLSRK